MESERIGIPDGSFKKSITQDFRQTVIIKPVQTGVYAGTIVFALIPGPAGGIAVNYGQTSFTTWLVHENTGAILNGTTADDTNGFTSIPDKYYTVAGRYSVIPYKAFVEAQSGTVLGQGINYMAATDFRVTSSCATLNYTGAPLSASGTGTCASVATEVCELLPLTVTGAVPASQTYMGSSLQNLPILPPFFYSDISTLPGATVFPALESRYINNPPQSFAYTPWRNNARIGYMQDRDTTGGNAWNLFNLAAVADPSGGGINIPSPGLGHTDITYVAYTGLDLNSSITIDHRQCVEFAISSNGPMINMAAPSPPADPPALATVQTLAREMPSSIPREAAQSTSGILTELLGPGASSVIRTIAGAGINLLPQPFSGIANMLAGIVI